MRGFRQSQCRAGKDDFSFAHEPPFFHRVFLEHDAGEPGCAGAVIPKHVQQILAAVIIVKQRRIKATAVQVDRIRPLSVDARAGNQVVVEVAQRGTAGPADGRAPIPFHVGVDQPEQPISVGKAGRPNAARIGIAEHVELMGVAERASK